MNTNEINDALNGIRKRLQPKCQQYRDDVLYELDNELIDLMERLMDEGAQPNPKSGKRAGIKRVVLS
jgi:hypothetical protein